MDLLSLTKGHRTLGLAPGASSDEVRVAYKRLALQYHPDKNRAGVDTTEVFQRISAAYKHISDASQNQHEGGGSMDDGDFDGTVPFDEFMQMFEAMFQKPSMSAFRTKKKAKGKRPGMRRRGGGRPRMDFDDILFAGMSAFGGMYVRGIASSVIRSGFVQGTVAFVGNVHYCKGDMVGIVFDEAVGKNNGTIKGVEYFTCAPQHGLMVQLCDVVRV
ncbi:hypothetical protein DYB25_007564 [Aphanomyces astaci]|uniref:J domain-containing protein n=1 Tax=Aphanomyces astaci TaxID=112090 RepID=A0A397CXF0_APHAT|nr:hypothetical protein DYB25_007564 [Aphanomyces astaci]RHY51648.1 hypothetical protein DYB30_005346 [Aphanomyces astaci]RHY57208.1 hypothetical protein DYB38_004676 [Aphanomyces astaci]RHY63669.1 hypothetical protein DYB34_003266 [Aphanomyces astaci]RHZ14328.1 hypothetical protein DYB26_001999 [Aphanomyces astaci]